MKNIIFLLLSCMLFLTVSCSKHTTTAKSKTKTETEVKTDLSENIQDTTSSCSDSTSEKTTRYGDEVKGELVFSKPGDSATVESSGIIVKAKLIQTDHGIVLNVDAIAKPIETTEKTTVKKSPRTNASKSYTNMLTAREVKRIPIRPMNRLLQGSFLARSGCGVC